MTSQTETHEPQIQKDAESLIHPGVNIDAVLWMLLLGFPGVLFLLVLAK
ncbi:MAG: hypothetical protein K2X66_14605 [Cyanobacteria bacterium]|nr:hypothetical protein [Cyanobacteriota bacterium]